MSQLTQGLGAGSIGDPPSAPLEQLHRDISLANQYRMEFIKHCMWLAGAVFVFTVSFIQDIVASRNADSKELVAWGWGAMVMSLLGGLIHLLGWDRFYISYGEDFHSLQLLEESRASGLSAQAAAALRKEGERLRARADASRTAITVWRRAAMITQFGGLLVGLTTIALFCYRNLQ
jgi:hypothetical protein